MNQSAGLITGSLQLGDDAMMATLRTQLEVMGIGELLGLFFEAKIVGLCMSIMAIIIFVVVFGRMIEVYLVISVAPIPLSTMANREWGNRGDIRRADTKYTGCGQYSHGCVRHTGIRRFAGICSVQDIKSITRSIQRTLNFIL